MSTSYAPVTQRPTPSESLASTTVPSPSIQEEELTTLDLQASVYVFPNPPSSPGGSSLFSVSSDFTGPFPGSSSAGSRERDHSISFSSDSRSIERSARPSTGGNSEDEDTSWHNTQSHSTAHSPNIDVEVWNWMEDSTEDIDEQHVWELEREVERVSRWDIPMPRGNRRVSWPTHSPSPPRTSAPQTRPNPLPTRIIRTYDVRTRDYHRMRTQSNLSSGSTWASLSTRASEQTPHPRIHIPLLSFIAYLFSLDLDDPALRLLTNSTSDSVLFPGHSGLLDPLDPSEIDLSGTSDDEEDSIEVARPVEEHGLLRLFSHSDESRVSLRSLKEGLGVVCNPSFSVVSSPISVPSFGSLFGLYHLFGDAWTKGGKALRELRSTAENPSST